MHLSTLRQKAQKILVFVALCAVALLMPLRAEEQAGISFNFKSVDIATIIESVAKITGKNFFIDPRVRGQVTLISNATVASDKIIDMLKMVLSLYGFQAIENEYATIIVPTQIASGIAPKVGKSDNDGLYDRVTEIIAINNVPTNTMSQILQPFLSQQSRVQVVPGSNTIIVSDIRANLERLRQIIKRIDKVTASDFDVLELRHAAVSDVLRSVRAIFGSSTLLKLEADQRTNRLFVVSDSLDTRLAVRAIVAELDIALPKDTNSGALQVFYLHYGEATKIAPIISSTLSSAAYKSITTDAEQTNNKNNNNNNIKTPVKASTIQDGKTKKNEFSIQADEKLNAIIVAGDSKTMFIARELIKQLDLPRKQVSMEIIIAEISNSKLYELGFNYLSAKNGFVTNLGNNPSSALIGAFGDGVTTSAKLGGAALQAGVAREGVFGMSADLDASGTLNWAALVRAIDSDGESNILSTPYVTTLDNEKAKLISGTEVPIETGSQTTSNNTTFRTVERKKVGINITITPQISSDNEIIMEIEQSHSALDTNTNIGSGVVTQEREIKTIVHAHNNEIIVMGGLQETRRLETTKRIPWLGSIPYIGSLFSYKKQTERKQNLIVFIRPTIIESSKDIATLSRTKYSLFRDSVDFEKAISEQILAEMNEHIDLYLAEPTLTTSSATADVSTPASKYK